MADAKKPLCQHALHAVAMLARQDAQRMREDGLYNAKVGNKSLATDCFTYADGLENFAESLWRRMFEQQEPES